MPAPLSGYFFGMVAVLTAAVVLLTGLPNISTIGNGRHYPCNRSDSYGGVTTALTEKSIGSKGCLSGRFHCKSGH
jgi:hypothetical protein